MLSPVFRDRILEFVQSRITLSELEEWLAPQLPKLLRESASADSTLAATVELYIAEFADGIRSEEECREDLLKALQALVPPPPSPGLTKVTTGTAVRTQHTTFSPLVNQHVVAGK